MLTIVIDKEIPYLESCVRECWPEVQVRALDGTAINTEAVRDAEALVVRTRTRVDERLLDGSRVQLVCTATIGYDHIDMAYCDRVGVKWSSCPGCNAQAVCDYIEEVLDEVSGGKGPLSIGVVGVGHVGSKVADMAARRGMKVLLNDPPKGLGVSLDVIARECDVVTFHTPLSTGGTYPTWHLCDRAFLEQTKQEVLIINAARGGVVDEKALMESGRRFVLDTWEGEPTINAEVVRKAERASMHIAGYSLEGKRNATQMCLDRIAEEFGLRKIVVPAEEANGDSAKGWIGRISEQLKQTPEQFESLRKAYRYR